MSLYEVFISHAGEDKKIAHAMCHFLEENGVRCWIAPRDIRHGQNYSEAIIDAISGQCKVLVVVFTKSANNSPYVKSEVERAFHHGLTIISFHVEDILPSKSLELFLGPTHWLDACWKSHEQYYSHLLKSINACLGTPPSSVGSIVQPPDINSSFKKRLLYFGLAVTMLVLVGVERKCTWDRKRRDWTSHAQLTELLASEAESGEKADSIQVPENVHEVDTSSTESFSNNFALEKSIAETNLQSWSSGAEGIRGLVARQLFLVFRISDLEYQILSLEKEIDDLRVNGNRDMQAQSKMNELIKKLDELKRVHDELKTELDEMKEELNKPITTDLKYFS